MKEENQQQAQELTFGMKLVGIDFNPSGDPKVTELKQLAARMADIVFQEYKVAGNGKPIEGGRLRDILADAAFKDIKSAVMFSVSFIANKH